VYRHRLSALSNQWPTKGKRNAASLVCHFSLQGVQEKICLIAKITIILGQIITIKFNADSIILFLDVGLN
jgi:hypothetical protein